MREIKFRAWDLKNKRFWSQKEMNEIGGFYYTYALSPEKDEFILLQFTGLKDKNGVEIYEGDILRFGDLLHKGVVQWKQYMWNVDGFYYSSQDNPGDAFSENYPCEVIGNIYQNPEIIK